MDRAGRTSSVLSDGSPPTTGGATNKRGGWNTFPFILATMAVLTLSGGGWMANLIVLLIQEFNIMSIDAAQISNVVNGCNFFIPVVSALIADSFLGCFTVIWISSLISLMGLILLVLSVTINDLKPVHCVNNGINHCATPSNLQYGVLYAAIALSVIGAGGSRSLISTMGANQFTKPKHQATFFSWYFITLYVASVIASTCIVYVEDNVSWSLGFGMCFVFGFLGLVIFLAGIRFYLHDKPQGSPFTSLARVVIASFRKRNEGISYHSEDYYYGDGDVVAKGMAEAELPTKSLRFLNRAAKVVEGDILPNGSAKPWKLCSVQQVEDLKSLIRILPLWSSSIFLSIPIAVQTSLTILQALVMNRHVTHNFQIPAGSILVFAFISTSVGLGLLEYVVWPTWKKTTGRNIPSVLQQIGIGHVFNVASMAISALVESKRLGTRSDPISVLWLLPQLFVVGIGEAFHFPGQVGFYYQEFPSCLKSMATAMISLLIGIAFYLSTAIIDFVRRVTNWLPNNINDGRIDNVYWVLVGIGSLNFGYYLICSWLYKCKRLGVQEEQLEESNM